MKRHLIQLGLLTLSGCSAQPAIIVGESVGPPTSITVSPSVLAGTPSSIHQFEAVVTDGNGNQINGPLSWTATGGIINDGLFEAGYQRGAFEVVVSFDESLTDTATVVLDAPITSIYPGDDIQAAIDSNPVGTEIFVKSGTHRLTHPVRPKVGTILTGETGAVITGARELTTFEREGVYWVAVGQTQHNPRFGPNLYGDEVCWQENDGIRLDNRTCIFPEDLFFDDVPLRQVGDLNDVVESTWFFDYDNDRIYFRDDPTGIKVETSVIEGAIQSNGAHGLIVQGLTIEKFANPAQTAALSSVNADDVMFLNNEVKLNHGAGVSITTGAGGQIIGNYIHTNGQMGIGSFRADDLIVEENEIAFNNYAGYAVGWEAGAMKISLSTNLRLVNNHSHDNDGSGLWLDGDNVNALVEGNTSEDNTTHGLHWEVSCSGTVRNNTFARNGTYGVVVSNSPNVEVHDNTVINNGWFYPPGHRLAHTHQLVARDTDRDINGLRCTLLLNNVHFHHNSITVDTSAGLDASRVSHDQPLSAVLFDHNSYYFTGLGVDPFSVNGNRLTDSAWIGLGHDANGTIQR